MKNLLLIVLLAAITLNINAQNTPKGVELYPAASGSTSFLYYDSHGNLWEGGGGTCTNRYNNGLRILQNKQWTPMYATGIFTDAIELRDTVYFAAYDGIYSLNNNQNFATNTSILKNTSLAVYNSRLMVGTYGNGLYEKTSTGYKRFPIIINGKSYDSINCLTTAPNNELWIGTTNGLILYNGSTFVRYNIPLNNSLDRNTIKKLKEIKSVQKDKDGRVWVLNNYYDQNNFSPLDSLECLYVLENGIFKTAIKYYKNECMKTLIPVTANRLALNNDGNVLLALNTGFIELSQTIKEYIISKIGNYYHEKIDISANIGSDNNGNIYATSPYYRSAKVNISQYDNTVFLANIKKQYTTIDINDIKSVVYNSGQHFNLPQTDNPYLRLPTFNVPSVSCASPILYASSIWMGGENSSNGDLHLAAETYRQNGNDYTPGPINLSTFANDSIELIPYNKIWKIDRKTIENFIANRTKSGYVIPIEILNWPAHGTGNFAKNLAPFVDTDNNGIYEPTQGDYPKIKGDQYLWWVFNDLGSHTETEGKSLGVEVHGSCYAYFNIGLPVTDSNYIINRTLFFNYKIINRSANDYNNFTTGIWNDVDLGNYNDDLVGCDTINNASFGYNGDNLDEGSMGFGKNPPIVFCKFLNKKMSNFIYYNNNYDPINGNPNTTNDYLNYLNAKWQNNKPMFFNAKYAFPENICNRSNLISNYEKRTLMTNKIPLLKKDSIINLEFAYSLLHNPDIDWLTDGCDEPNKILRRIQNWYDKDSFPSKPYYGVNIKKTSAPKQDFIVFPNPANTILNIQSSYNHEIKSIEIFDNIGQLVYSELPKENAGTITTSLDIRAFATGIYIVKLKTNNGNWSTKIMKE